MRVVRVEPVPRSPQPSTEVALVVDVIRATSTAAVLLDRGAQALWLTRSLEAARALRTNGELLLGEVGGLRPEGFDLGNSPREASQAAVAGRVVIQSTTNGTKAAHLAAEAPEVLLASLLNAPAAANLAAQLASSQITVVCAGKEGQLGVDDLYTAGVLVERLRSHGFVPQGDGAWLALELVRAQPDPLAVLQSAEAALALVREGLGEDVPYCAQVGLIEAVPRLQERRGAALVFTKG